MSAALLAFQSSEDPVDDSNVLSEARPQEFAVLVATEPVHVVDLGHLQVILIVSKISELYHQNSIAFKK